MMARTVAPNRMAMENSVSARWTVYVMSAGGAAWAGPALRHTMAMARGRERMRFMARIAYCVFRLRVYCDTQYASRITLWRPVDHRHVHPGGQCFPIAAAAQ